MSIPLRVARCTRVGGEVDVGVGAGKRVELDGRHGAERLLAGRACAVGQVEVDAVAVDGDEGGSFNGLVAGQIGKYHTSNLVAPSWRGGLATWLEAGTRGMPGIPCMPCRVLRNVPLPIDPIICGQYIDIAMPVKKAAMSGLMPLLETLESHLTPGSCPVRPASGTSVRPVAAVCRRIGVADTGSVQGVEEGVAVGIDGVGERPGRRASRPAATAEAADGHCAGSINSCHLCNSGLPRSH